MRLLCHRGYWSQESEKNSWAALTAALSAGLGIETDVRDCNGLLVVSHDPPKMQGALPLEDLLAFYAASARQPCLALNVKADGLQASLLEALQRHKIDNYFTFDMAVPDTLGYHRLDMPFAARISEYEPTNVLLEAAAWVWLDAFHGEWFSLDTVSELLDRGKRVAIVSSELHGRSHEMLWSDLLPLQRDEKLYLCTDYVQKALDYFDVQQD